MRHLRSALSVGFLLAVSMLPASGQETAAVTEQPLGPEAVAQAFLDTMVAEGLGATGRFFAPAALEEIKTAFLGLLDLEAGQGEGELRGLLFGADRSLEQVQALAPADFYRGVMRFVEAQMGESSVNLAGGEVLGAVMEGETLAHVVTRVRMGIGENGMDTIDVISLRRTEKGWALLLKGEMQQMIQAIRAQVDLARANEAPVEEGEGEP